MLRRLYFLFPDEKHAQSAVDQLINRRIPKHRIHAIAEGVKLTSLPEATQRQKNDTAFHIEQILWTANIVIFAVALIVFVTGLVAAQWLWSGFALAVMLITFFAGQQFVMRIPDDHLTEFTDALSRGEILLMVDVSLLRVVEIKSFVQHRHPEATGGGISWTVDAFGI